MDMAFLDFQVVSPISTFLRTFVAHFHYVDSMPIASIGGILCDVLFNPKHAGCVSKVTVAIDTFRNIAWNLSVGPWDIGGCSHLGSRRDQKEQGALYGL